jgi:hypothetical protein
MKVVRGRADARWMPSRYTFALCRLYAFLKMRNAKPEVADVAFVADRHQSAAENFTVGAWILLTLTAYAAATLARWWAFPIAVIAALPVALLLLQLSITIVGIILIRRENNLRVNSVVMMAWMTAAAVYFARSQSWVRFVAWQFLTVLALNAIAAVVVLLLRAPIANVESSLGGFSSEL